MRHSLSLGAALLMATTAPPVLASQLTVTAPIKRHERTTSTPTALSSCHGHSTEVWCEYGTEEYQVIVPATATAHLPPAYTACHAHEPQFFCFDEEGEEVEVLGVLDSDDGHSHEGAEEEETSKDGQMSCHFHAGVEHCVGGDESQQATCNVQDRNYNIPLRIGLIFVMMATSLIGVMSPILLSAILPKKANIVFLIIKQFGTGVIISTAFVHLFTHANLMFTNECLGDLHYEATTAAIVMAGLFLTWLVEYVSHRGARKYWARSQYNDELVSVVVLELGIIFHSVLIGITVVVAGDSYFGTLFAVIVFHQMFEGIALGSRIASIGQYIRPTTTCHGSSQSVIAAPRAEHKSDEASGLENHTTSSETNLSWTALTMSRKLILALPFAITTPVGMAIGIGVLNHFNGNDPSTIIALGTLNALSAGILIWVGVVEMWADDWMHGGELEEASVVVTLISGFSLVAGLVLMSFLGKWA